MSGSHTADERGQSLSEVTLLLALFVLIAEGVLRTLGISLSQLSGQVTQLCVIEFKTPISDGY